MTTAKNHRILSSVDARRYRFAVVVSQFHRHITQRLESGAMRCFKEHGVPAKNVLVEYCPGAFELPQVAHRLLSHGQWDAVVCLGAVIRGETAHFEYVASESSRGIQEVALRHGRPVIFGVLTTENERQAIERAGGKHGNKGWDAAAAAIEMADLFRRLLATRRGGRK